MLIRVYSNYFLKLNSYAVYIFVTRKILPYQIIYTYMLFHDQALRLQTYILMSSIKIDFYALRLEAGHSSVLSLFLLAFVIHAL